MLLQILVYLAHFGFWMNVTLVAGMLIAGMILSSAKRKTQSAETEKRRSGEAQKAKHHSPFTIHHSPFVKPFSIQHATFNMLIAQLLAVLLFYSAYIGLFLDQLGSTATGGLTGLAGRGAVPADILWAGLINGLYAHVGMLPVLLAPLALFLPRCSGWRGRGIVWALSAASFALGLGFAILPFLSGSTLSTRWLMFCLWAIWLCAAAIAERLWNRGRFARIIVGAAACYVLWLSAVMWISALAWRVRPPEPF